MAENLDDLASAPGQTCRATCPVVLITGASKGIGRALAHEFARAGHNIFLVARDPSSLEKTANELRAHFSVKVVSCPIDLLKNNSADQLNNAVRENGCFTHILINNAALAASGEFVGTDTQSKSDLIKLNVTVPTELIDLFLPDMLKRKSGGVINIASTAGLAPVPYLASYGASKSYIISLTRAIQREVAGNGVHIMAVTPGPVATSFMNGDGVQKKLIARLYPKIIPETAARITIDGFRRRRVVVTPGILNAFVATGAKLIPPNFIARQISRFTRPPAHPVPAPGDRSHVTPAQSHNITRGPSSSPIQE